MTRDRTDSSASTDEGPVDLGSLDPARDASRWQGRIDEVVARAVARRAARSSLTTLSVLSALAPLAAAAAIALVAAAAALARWREPPAAATGDPVTAFLAPGSDAGASRALVELAMRREP